MTLADNLDRSLNSSPVFLFGILGMESGPSELGKLAQHKLWKLGKVEMYKKYFKHKRIQFKTQ